MVSSSKTSPNPARLAFSLRHTARAAAAWIEGRSRRDRRLSPKVRMTS